jgi:hypothetical protein
MKLIVKTSSRDDKLLRKILIEYLYNEMIDQTNKNNLLSAHKRNILLHHLRIIETMDEDMLVLAKERGLFNEIYS